MPTYHVFTPSSFERIKAPFPAGTSITRGLLVSGAIISFPVIVSPALLTAPMSAAEGLKPSWYNCFQGVGAASVPTLISMSALPAPIAMRVR
ncbi:hypothetical protein D3C78_1237210 [compost metagenome]